MREIRKSGSEGGGARERSPYPYGFLDATDPSGGDCGRFPAYLAVGGGFC